MNKSTLQSIERTPLGAEVVEEGVLFRIWAPRRQQMHVVLVDVQGNERQRIEMEEEADGYFSVHAPSAKPNDLYWFQCDDESKRYPDPASRFQPQGVHGPSQVIDPSTYNWQDADWTGVTMPGQVIYELHIGAYTAEGTWAAAIDKLAHLRDVGVTVVEVMPVNEFHGDFGWGYDGVYWYAPTRLYGRPDDFRAFVDEAHRLGLGVILDVVYNHFGPTGNYVAAYTPHFASQRHPTEWGDAINYDGQGARGVRDFVTANAAHWIREYHLDGLRLDATQAIFDDSRPHILADLTAAAREAAGERSIIVVAENEFQHICHVESPDADGYGMDGVWNDDFHHACRVAATGHAEYYYGDYAGSPQELISALRWGYLYQGQWTPRQKRYRGTPTRRVAAEHFIHFLQNHDQVANSAQGLPLHMLTSPGRHRALTAVLLLGPQTPMLFMGQEIGSTSPFLFFADHEVDIASLVRDGRWEFLRMFPRAAGFGEATALPDPSARETYEKSKVNWSDGERQPEFLLLHRDLLRLRKQDAMFSQQDAEMLEGAVVGPEAFILRWFDEEGDDDRLMIVNLGRDLRVQYMAHPLLASPAGTTWALLWSSEDPRYGGSGTATLDMQNWNLPGHAAIILHPQSHQSSE
jgi:maltooligosyltrehalose trehalohydrolase